MNIFKALTYRLRPFVETDIPAILKIALRNTFQYSPECLMLWSKYDPKGITVAELHSGEVVGLCASINHNENIAFRGALCVHEKYRKLQIGHWLSVDGAKHVGDRNMGSNCSKGKLRYFQNKGFRVVEDSWTIVEYKYLGELKYQLLSYKLPEGVGIKCFEVNDIDFLLAYDRALAGYDRKGILDIICKENNTKTLIAFSGGVCVGYGMIKRNIFDAARVGPLYADDSRVAEVMLRKLLETMPDAEGLAMTTISNNLMVIECMMRMGIPVHDNLMRVYTKEKMVINTSKIFAQFDVDFSLL
ncbi:n-acetyltransferase domain-containing protein [Nephila pilipes]|uniref:N-acetyltransferase domain-containing protein n=1 Tax=Nephila pilipes TaxID=299642 RepID=A0A8X6U2V2_NEPPI|nr:n-acetyltransferase domain-containing protein [Nephila pilipes]